MTIFHSPARFSEATSPLEQVLQSQLSSLLTQAQLGISQLLWHHLWLQSPVLGAGIQHHSAQVLLNVGSSLLSSPDLSLTGPFYREIVEAGKIKIRMLWTCILMCMQSATTPSTQCNTTHCDILQQWLGFQKYCSSANSTAKLVCSVNTKPKREVPLSSGETYTSIEIKTYWIVWSLETSQNISTSNNEKIFTHSVGRNFNF